MEILDFKMPDFRRISWISAEAKNYWQPRLENLSLELEEKLEKSFKSVYPLYFKEYYAHELDEPLPRLLHQLDFDDQTLNQFFIDRTCDDHKVASLFGKAKPFRRAVSAIENVDVKAFHLAMGVPECCASKIEKLQTQQQRNYLWLNSSAIAVKNRKVVHGQFTNNLIFAALGLRLINHVPCSENCKESHQIALKVMDHLQNSMSKDALELLEEVLSWSFSLSTLRGITEIKTPIFKMIQNAQPTAVKYQVDWHGTREPDTGLCGLGFPYKNPEKLVFSESASFKKGLANNLEGEATADS